MISSASRRLVTIDGECFDVKYLGEVAGHRDGVLHHFHLMDLKTDRILPASVFRPGARDTYTATVAEYDRRENTVIPNAIRRAFDKGVLSFEHLLEGSQYQEIQLEPADFQPQPRLADEEVRGYLIQKAYFLSYLDPQRPNPNGEYNPIPFGDEIDLEYLGIKYQDVVRNVRRLVNQKMLDTIFDDNAKPTEQLLLHHESGGDTLRKFARKAIEQARKSVAEDNTEHHPKVGAVVVKNGKVLSEAHRGEIPGNHAEFIAMELKLPDETLVGATVYTTLEPCTTRNHPKVPCAERLIERKVAKVVIGMLDPDKRITGQGVSRLRKANVTVELFPSDLAQTVEELNRDFMRDREQQRATEEEEKTHKDRLIEAQKREIADLKRKPYEEALEKKVEILLSSMSSTGKRLLRHLLENEPLEVGRPFVRDISTDDQSNQLMIAINSGIVRINEVRAGSGMIVRQDYVFTVQYHPVLRDVLYRD